MNNSAKKQLIALIAVLAAGSGLTFIALGGIDENLIYYLEPDELLAQSELQYGKPVRLGGVVKNGSLLFDEQSLALEFRVGVAPEVGGPTILVNATGSPPQMFREGVGVVVEGKYDGTKFNADRVLVKHSNEYRAPEEGETKSAIETLDVPTD